MELKQLAALHALEYVQDGMRLGLGTGSTARLFIAALGQRWRDGAYRDLRCVPTSKETAQQVVSLGLPLITLTELQAANYPPVLDLAVDGADEVDPDLNLIKGLGKAALREKIIEMHALRFIVIVDESKLVPRLGRGALPVELIPFEAEVSVRWLEGLGCRAELWRDDAGRPFETDNHNWLARCWFSQGIADPVSLARRLADQPGIVEHGLFLGMATDVIVARQNGVEVITKNVKTF